MKIKGSLFVVVLFLIDIISKYYIESILEVSESIVIIKNFFSITYALNTGAAFSILEGNMIFFYTVSVIGLVFMAFLYKSSKKNIEKYSKTRTEGLYGKYIYWRNNKRTNIRKS